MNYQDCVQDQKKFHLNGAKIFYNQFRISYVSEMGNYAIFPRGKSSAKEGGSITISPNVRGNIIILEITDNDGEIMFKKIKKVSNVGDESILNMLAEHKSVIEKCSAEIKW